MKINSKIILASILATSLLTINVFGFNSYAKTSVVTSRPLSIPTVPQIVKVSGKIFSKFKIDLSKTLVYFYKQSNNKYQNPIIVKVNKQGIYTVNLQKGNYLVIPKYF